MAVSWSDAWKNASFNDVDPTLDKADILSIIQSINPSILRVQPAAVREAVNLVLGNSADVTIIKGLHHVGTEKIDIKKTGGPGGPGPVVHLYCMRYSLVDAGLSRFIIVGNDVFKHNGGWRITGSSVSQDDGNPAYQGMDKDGEIATLRQNLSRKDADTEFRNRHY